MLQVFKLITCQQVLITVLHDKWSLSYQSDEESVRLYADQRETTPFGTYIWYDFLENYSIQKFSSSCWFKSSKASVCMKST